MKTTSNSEIGRRSAITRLLDLIFGPDVEGQAADNKENQDSRSYVGRPDIGTGFQASEVRVEKAVRADGGEIGIAHAFYRNIFLLLGSMLGVICTVIAMSRIGADQFMALDRHQFHELEIGLRPEWYRYVVVTFGVYSFADLIAMYVTKKNQTLHDLAGDTVVVHAPK